MKAVKFGDVEISWPQGWEELEREARADVARCAVGFLAISGVEVAVVWREIFELICRESWRGSSRSFRKWWKGLGLSIEQWDELRAITAWVTEKPKDKPFDDFTHKGVRYYVLPERFEKVSSAEWVEGIMDFLDLVSGDSSLELLIANFCRPVREDLEAFRRSAEWNGDVREVYNRQKAIERAEVLADLDLGVKVQMLWWYEGQITAFFSEFEDLFKGGSGDARYPDGRGYLMLLKNVAKMNYMGDFEAVCKADVLAVFAILLDEVYDAQEMEDKMKNRGK